jgi:hypothetical protein
MFRNSHNYKLNNLNQNGRKIYNKLDNIHKIWKKNWKLIKNINFNHYNKSCKNNKLQKLNLVLRC